MDNGRTRRVPRAPRNVSCSGGGTPPLRRLRRSLRLSGQRQGTTRSEGTLCLVHDAAACPSQGSRGSSAAAVPERRVALTELPLEVLFHVFLHCDVDSLSVLSICSLLLRDQLVGYLSWAPALKALSFRHMHQKDAVKQCRNLGVLMKRVTCLFPTKERLKIMLRFIEKFVSRPTLVRSHLPRDLEAAGRQWHQYGAFLMAAVVGWVDSECQLVHDVLLGLSSAQRFTSRVLGARPGQLRRDELALRHFLRCLFLSEVSPEDSCAWLQRLLQPWPLVFRAKLLYIIYGPCCHHELLWVLPSLPQTAMGSPLLRASLAHMGAALSCLHEEAAGWSSDDTITVIEELFVMSREWLPVNRAMLLAHCGVDICVLLLSSKLVNGRECEVASVLYNLILVQYHVSRSTTFVIDVARALSDAVGHTRFLSEMPLHSDTLVRDALVYYSRGGESGYEQICHALLYFASSMLRLSCREGPNYGRLCSED
ncbi:F-box only protein 47-like isoform X2 [Dermacentor variabilis]|uniref:F-box only protein 47-like isoform X2 n=1 Tax=Dermacentor variabilis TaxID=34621 RepID=UPI003F5CA14E